jgi:hypothetical protein
MPSGDSQLAFDLSPDQVSGLGSSLQLQSTASPNIFFVFANANPRVSVVTSTPGFRDAVRSPASPPDPRLPRAAGHATASPRPSGAGCGPPPGLGACPSLPGVG